MRKLKRYTLDTNCIVAIDEGRPEATAIRRLVQAHRDRNADVALVAMSASERQKGGRYLTDFHEFEARLRELELSDLPLLPPLAYWDVTFFDHCLWAGEDDQKLELAIHEVLFPSVQFEFKDYCIARNLDPKEGIDKTWRNAKCDVLMLWTHIHHGREIFVTGDDNFHAVSKKPTLVALGAGDIVYPDDALLPAL